MHQDQPESKAWYIPGRASGGMAVGLGGRKGRGMSVCQWHPFSCCTPESCFQKKKNMHAHIAQICFFLSLTIVRPCILSDLFTQNYKILTAVLHSLMPCQHWMWVAHHHITKLNSSYYNQQICLHLKWSLLLARFFFCTQFSRGFFSLKNLFVTGFLPVFFFVFCVPLQLYFSNPSIIKLNLNKLFFNHINEQL